MLYSVSNIIIKRRIRKELGDIELLKKSIQKHGLLNPIIINSKGELIAGFRRLEAIKQLGWTEVEVKIIDPKDAVENLEIEMEENIVRKDFTQEEILEGIELKKKLLNPNIFVKIWNFLVNLFKKIFKIK